MKDRDLLVIKNNEAEILHCSSMGSYYLPVERFKINKKSVSVWFKEPFGGEITRRSLSLDECTLKTEYYCDEDSCREFLKKVKSGKISIKSAAHIILNEGAEEADLLSQKNNNQ